MGYKTIVCTMFDEEGKGAIKMHLGLKKPFDFNHDSLRRFIERNPTHGPRPGCHAIYEVGHGSDFISVLIRGKAPTRLPNHTEKG